MEKVTHLGKDLISGIGPQHCLCLLKRTQIFWCPACPFPEFSPRSSLLRNPEEAPPAWLCSLVLARVGEVGVGRCQPAKKITSDG